MREKDLLQIWNGQRSQRISSQLGPTILLAVILILVATGKLNYKSALDIKAFAIGLVAAGEFSRLPQCWLRSVTAGLLLGQCVKPATYPSWD